MPPAQFNVILNATVGGFFKAKLGASSVSRTPAEVPETGNQTQEDALMSDAIKKMTEGGLIKFDIRTESAGSTATSSASRG